MENVDIGECRCPGTPHETDTVGMRPRLGLAAGVALQRAVADFLLSSERRTEDKAIGILVEYYVLEGVAEWNLVDENGKPLPLNDQTMREQLLDDFARSRAIADKGDDLYKGPVLGPLLSGASKSSKTTSSNGSTSAKASTSLKLPKRSKPSSTTTSQTDSTETTTDAPDGGSSS